MLAKILYARPNFLVLDEPTNHLDITTKDMIVRSLADYEGTMLFVSHDRQFLARLSNRVLELGPDGPTLYGGGYTEYVSPERPRSARACGRLPANPGEPKKEGPMHLARRIVSLVFVQLLLLAAVRTAGAADAKEAMEKLKALSQGAAASYGDGDFDKTRSQLQEAVALAKESGLGSNRMMAQVYILFGVLKINEHKDTEAGVRYFAKALDISPAVKIPPTMATKAVKAAFAKAEDVDPATIGDLSEADAPTSAKKPSKKEKEKEEAAAAAEQEKQEKQEKAPPRPARRPRRSSPKLIAGRPRRSASRPRRTARVRRREQGAGRRPGADQGERGAAEVRQGGARQSQLGDAKGYLRSWRRRRRRRTSRSPTSTPRSSSSRRRRRTATPSSGRRARRSSSSKKRRPRRTSRSRRSPPATRRSATRRRSWRRRSPNASARSPRPRAASRS